MNKLFWLPLIFYIGRLTVSTILEPVFYNILPKHYIFEASELQQIVQSGLTQVGPDASSEQVMKTVYELLSARYGSYIVKPRGEDWVFNNAGNAMGSMVILHASLTEYLIFFGTAIGTEGHTGTHFADDYFTILYGKQLAAPANATRPEVYLPGEQHHLPYGRNKQYAMPSDSWALELAQGYIPSMLPFGLIEVLTSTFDIFNFVKTIRLTAVQMFNNLLRGKF